jgi:membrane protein involved in colicin uptake
VRKHKLQSQVIIEELLMKKWLKLQPKIKRGHKHDAEYVRAMLSRPPFLQSMDQQWDEMAKQQAEIKRQEEENEKAKEAAKKKKEEEENKARENKEKPKAKKKKGKQRVQVAIAKRPPPP